MAVISPSLVIFHGRTKISWEGDRSLVAKVSVSPTAQLFSMQFTEPRILGNQWMGGVELGIATSIKAVSIRIEISMECLILMSHGEEYETAGSISPSDAQMAYDSHYIFSTLSTGYTWPTRLGRFGLSTGLRLSWEYITYEPGKFTPHNSLIRDNLNIWKYSDNIFFV